MSLYCGFHSHISQVTFLMSDLHVVTRANRPFRTQLSVQWLVNRLNWNKNICQVKGPSFDLKVSKSSASFQQWQSFTHRSTDIDICFFQQVQHKKKSLQILMKELEFLWLSFISDLPIAIFRWDFQYIPTSTISELQLLT